VIVDESSVAFAYTEASGTISVCITVPTGYMEIDLCECREDQAKGIIIQHLVDLLEDTAERSETSIDSIMRSLWKEIDGRKEEAEGAA